MTSMTSTKSKAGLIGIGSALIGSLLFAIVEGIGSKIEYISSIPELIRSNFFWIVFVFCVSCVLSIVPGYLGGRTIARLSQNGKWSRSALMVLGAALGILAVVSGTG